MNAFQLVALPALGLVLAATLLALARDRISRLAGVSWSAVWIAALVFIANPDLSTQAAKLFGIGRGVDLLVYSSILFMLVSFLRVYLRLKKLERDMTRLVRRLALERGPLP